MAEDERGSEQTAARGKGGLREKQLIHQQRHSHQSEPALGCAGEGGDWTWLSCSCVRVEAGAPRR